MMNNCFKYVMDIKKMFVIFPRGMSHDRFIHSGNKCRFGEGHEVRSAGFVQFLASDIIGTESFYCYGKSESLGIGSNKEDGKIMEAFYKVES